MDILVWLENTFIANAIRHHGKQAGLEFRQEFHTDVAEATDRIRKSIRRSHPNVKRLFVQIQRPTAR